MQRRARRQAEHDGGLADGFRGPFRGGLQHQCVGIAEQHHARLAGRADQARLDVTERRQAVGGPARRHALGRRPERDGLQVALISGAPRQQQREHGDQRRAADARDDDAAAVVPRNLRPPQRLHRTFEQEISRNR